MRSLLKILVGLGLSALTLYLFLRSLDLSKVWASLAGANVGLLLLAIVIGYFGHLTTRSWRWATMLRPLKTPVSFYNLFSTTAIGYAISWLVPLRIGEVARPVLLARREGIPAGGVLATAGIERILDGAAVLALAAAASLTTPLWWHGAGPPVMLSLPGLGDRALVSVVAVLGGVMLAGCALGVLVARVLLAEGGALPRFLERRSRKAVRPAWRAVWDFAQSVAAGAGFLRDTRAALRISAESLVIWIVIGASVWTGLLAAGVRLPFPGVFLLLALSVIGIAIPTPGGMGSVQLFFQWGLTKVFGVEANLAAAATFLYHPVIVYIPPIIFGLLFAWRDGLRPGSLGALTRLGDGEAALQATASGAPAGAPAASTGTEWDGCRGGAASTPRGAGK